MIDTTHLIIGITAAVQIAVVAYGYGKLNAKVESLRQIICGDTVNKIKGHEDHCYNYQPNTSVRPNPLGASER